MENATVQNNGDSAIQIKNSNINLQLSPSVEMDETIKDVKRYGDHRGKTIVGFEKADWKKALMMREKNSNSHCHGEEVSCMVDVEHFKMYGPGLYLFFLFIQKVSFLFALMSVIYMAPLIYNFINGNYLDQSLFSLQIFAARLMVGNQMNKQSDESFQDKLISVIPDIICTVLFLIFYFYWDWLQDKEVKNIKQTIKYPSDFTIEVMKVGDEKDEKEIENTFRQFGNIQEVSVVRNFEQMISLSKQAYQMSLAIKEHRILCINSKEKEDQKWIEQEEAKIDLILQQLKQIEEKEHHIIKYFVVFEEEESKKKALQAYQPFKQGCCSCCKKQQIPQQILIKGVLPHVKACGVQPGGIMWENMHITWKTRWIRFLIQTIFILIFMVGGFLIISLLNLSIPSTSNSTEYQGLTFEAIKTNENQMIQQSWCLNTNLPSTGSEEDIFCEPYLENYYNKIAISVAISFLIVVLKLILKHIVIAIAKFQRYKSHTELATNVMTNLMFIYICTTVLIIFLLQANIFDFSLKKVIADFTNNSTLKKNSAEMSDYADFTNDWYFDIGYQIWLNWFILAFIPHSFMPIYHYAYEKIAFWMGRKQVMHKNMMGWIEKEEFQIEDHYANVLMIIFVGFSFSAGIPSLVFLSLIGLFSRYLYFRFAFIRFSKVPRTYTLAMANRVKFFIPIFLLSHMFFGIWMFGVPEIFGQHGIPQIEEWANSKETSARKYTAVLMMKLTQTWYLTVLLFFIIVILIFRKVFVKCIYRNLKKKEGKYKEGEQAERQREIDEKKQEREFLKKSQRTITRSYRIQNNPDYIQILAIMKPTQAKDVIRCTSKISRP